MTSITGKQTTEKEIAVKTTTLFQLGGTAVLLSAILTGIGNLIYFLSGQPDLEKVPLIWRGIFAGVLFIL